MRYIGLKYVVAAVLLWALGAAAQTVHQPVAVSQPTGAYIAFKFDWDQGQPWVRYTISVDDAGNTHFDGVGNPIQSGDNDAFAEDFTMSGANRQKIFELVKKADYFQGNLEAKQKNLAQTGQKTLVYQGRAGGGDQVIKSSAIYNYSPNNDVQELTRIFQAIATTIDFGRKLAFQYRFDKLGIDATLRSIQDMQASHYVEEMQSIEPILQKIASDPNMMHINRVTAKQLLNSAGPPGVHAQTSNQP